MDTSRWTAPTVLRLLTNVSAWPGVTTGACEWGGQSVFSFGVEFARLLPCGLLDVRVTLQERARLLREGRARPHRFWPESEWVTVTVEDDDFGRALALLVRAYVFVTPANVELELERDRLAHVATAFARARPDVLTVTPRRRRVRMLMSSIASS